MSCGVCAKICTLALETCVDTVAVGFSAFGLYSGPTPSVEGTGISTILKARMEQAANDFAINR